MEAHVEELEEAAAEAARRAAAERTVRALAHDWLSWLEEVWGAKPSTVKDYSFLLREPGQPFKRGSGTSPGRIMEAFGAAQLMRSRRPRSAGFCVSSTGRGERRAT